MAEKKDSTPALSEVGVIVARYSSRIQRDISIEQQDLENFALDFDSMPDYVKSDIAAAAWAAVQRFMLRPDAQAILDAERERLLLEGSTLLDPRYRKKGR